MPVHAFATSLGRCEVHYEDGSVTAFRLPEAGPPEESAVEPPPPWVSQLAARVGAHLAGAPQDFADVPFAWDRVPAFHQAVFRALLEVKSGRTATYGELARAVGQPPAASRAVGTALGQNPWPLLVPCHRCIGADGRMTGFSGPGGIRTKLRLLALEGSEWFAE